MQLKEFLERGGQRSVVYVRPSVYVVSYRSEGFLCIISNNYGEPDQPGKDLTEGDNGWEF